MKIPHLNLRNQRHDAAGSVLLICMLITFIVGTVLASFLILTQTQNYSVVRSQSWNGSIALTEAGVEEALSQLNRGAPYFDPTVATNNFAVNGWTDNGNGSFSAPRRYLGQDYYDVTVIISGLTPIINSTGQTYLVNSHVSAPQTMFATVGVNDTGSQGTYLTRRVRVNTKIDPLFNVAMAAIKKIDFNGKNVETDSFDSVDPLYSTNGLYTSSKRKANGDVVTDDVVTNSLSVGNAKVRGQVKTGPKGTINVGPNGSVGDLGWVDGGTTGIQPGHSADDMNVVFPDPTLPATTWTAPSHVNTTIGGVTYDYVLGDGDWTLPSMGGGNWKMYISGNARLYVTGSSVLSGNDVIRMADSNASLKMYLGGATVRIGGNGIINPTGNAANLYVYGLTSNTSLNFSGNASVTGAIYAPQADFSLGGGGSEYYDFIGASVSKTVTMNGHFKFHYDENLRRIGPARGIIPTNWKEI